MLRQLLLVALGGAIGSAMRYLTAILLARHYTGSIPLATLVVNVLGCFLIGLLIGLCSETTYLRLLFITGFWSLTALLFWGLFKLFDTIDISAAITSIVNA